MLKDRWHSAGIGTRGGLIGGIVVILALTLAATWWLLQSRNAVLFSDLEPGDAAAVVSELERMKVNYKLAGDGTRILVSQDDVYEIRLKLLGSGLPLSGGVGFELFDKAEFGMTEFAQRINFQRAMQGELTRTITSLKEVKYARVHLVMPEASLFRQNKTSPSASITLFLNPGTQLDQQQTEGIQRLVSASVPGLETSAVTILDQYGKTLSALAEDESRTVSVTSRLQKKKEVEAYITEKTVRVLERAFGAGKAIVSIDVTLNFDQSKTTREEVIPGSNENGGVVRKRESRTQPTKGKKSAKNPGDVNTEVEYRLGRSVAQIVSTPGGIERLSVGVLVPLSTTEEQLRQIEDLVAMAVGLDPSRGDAIAVHAATGEILPFQQEKVSLEMQLPSDITTQAVSGITVPRSSEDFVGSPADKDSEQIENQATGRENLRGGLTRWISGLWVRYPEFLIISGIAVVFILLFIVSLEIQARRKQRLKQTRLLSDERERILSQLKAWINADELTSHSEAKS